MRLITHYYKRLRITFIKTALLAAIVSAFFLPHYIKIESTGNNTFMVILNGVECGTVGSEEEADKCIRDARKIIALQSEELVFVDADLELQGSEVYFGVLDEYGTVLNNITKALRSNIKETLQRSYTVKVNETTINLATRAQVERLLNAAIDKYDTENTFNVSLAADPSRELNVLSAQVTQVETQKEQEEAEAASLHAGIESTFDSIMDEADGSDELGFEDYELGIVDISFNENVEVVEAYLPESEISDYETELNLLTEEQEIQQIYEIQPGDTLSGISMTVNIPLDDIIALNDSLESENTIIHAGQELIITVPEPELSVVRQEQNYYEESYEADVIYVDNDTWYTTQQVTLQEPTAGYRKVVADVTYQNNQEIAREIVKEEVVVEAVPKIVERGTITPPTYIKPLSGGRISSYFGRRSISLAGASRYHLGVDWATPVGTTVVASCGGRVAKAGWASGYGYVVYINHSDGRQTRYAHLSRVLVSVGQTVVQGERIAYSGNTGRSSGPHVHFEILINGSQVNPLNYIS